MTLKLLPVGLMPLLLCGCAGSGSRTGTVVVYVSQDRVFAEPILRDFGKATGIAVQAVYDDKEAKTAGLMERLIAEKNNPRADVYWANEPVRAELLKQRGVSAAIPLPECRGHPGSVQGPRRALDGLFGPARVILARRGRWRNPRACRRTPIRTIAAGR